MSNQTAGLPLKVKKIHNRAGNCAHLRLLHVVKVMDLTCHNLALG